MNNTTEVPIPGRRPATLVLSADELYARRIGREAHSWITYAQGRSEAARALHGPALKPHAITAKALDAVAFAMLRRPKALAVPSKLAGTAGRQQALSGLAARALPYGAALDVREEPSDGKGGTSLVVSYLGEDVGEVQTKHAPWARPLLGHGLSVHLLAVTGTDDSAKTLGVNVALGGVASAIERLLAAEKDAAMSPAVLPASTGDGADVGTLVLPGDRVLWGDGLPGAATVAVVRPLYPRADAVVFGLDSDTPDAADVKLWRGPGGLARASVAHVVRHSPTGLGWGYVGSGPADTALSVLAVFTDRVHAERLSAHFAYEVVARVPTRGGVLRAAAVRRWLEAEGAPVVG